MINENIRNRILEAARFNFSKYGYTKVKTYQLASELGISKRTLYEHFKSKEDILNNVIQLILLDIEQKINDILKKLKKDAKANFIEELMNLCELEYSSFSSFTKELLDDLKKNQIQSWQTISDFRKKQIRLHFNKIYEIGVKKGYVKEDLDKDLFYLIHQTVTNNILNSETISQLSISMNQAILEVYRLILTGALTIIGQKEFEKKLKSISTSIRTGSDLYISDDLHFQSGVHLTKKNLNAKILTKK